MGKRVTVLVLGLLATSLVTCGAWLTWGVGAGLVALGLMVFAEVQLTSSKTGKADEHPGHGVPQLDRD